MKVGEEVPGGDREVFREREKAQSTGQVCLGLGRCLKKKKEKRERERKNQSWGARGMAGWLELVRLLQRT